MYKDIDSPSNEHQYQATLQRRQYTREQLLALQNSPLVSKPASLPPLSSWLTRESTTSTRPAPNNHSTTGAHNRFIQPKASISTPSRSSNYSKMVATTGRQWNHRQDQLEGHHYHQHHPTGSSDTNSSIFDDEGIPEWMDDNPSDLTKDERTEKMVLDSSQMEEWKLRMKQMDDDKAKKMDRKRDRAHERGNNENRRSADDENMSSLLALEALHLTATNSMDNSGSYSTKSISVEELFKQQHLPSSPSLSPSSQQQSSSSSTIKTTSFLLSPRDDQIGGFGNILPNQSILPKDNGNFMGSTQRNVTQHEQHQQYQRPPPGFMLPSPEHQSRMKLQPNDSISPNAFSIANGVDNPRPPPMMTYSFSTGTTGSYHPMLHHRQPMLSPSFLPNINTTNHSMAMLPQQLPSHYQQHPSMIFNTTQSMFQPQPYQRLQQQQYHHHFIPPSMHPQQQQPHFTQQTHSFPSQLLHHPYQPLVSDLNK